MKAVFVYKCMSIVRDFVENKETILYFSRSFFVSLVLNIVYFVVFSVWHDFYIIWFAFNFMSLIKIIVAVILFCFLCVFTVTFVYPFWCISKVNEHKSDLLGGRVFTYEGSPGTGKTYSMTFDGYYMSQYSFLDLQFEYYKLSAKINSGGFDDIDEFWYFCIVRDSFEFYNQNSGIPCLWSNYPIFDKSTGAMSFELLQEHFTQEKRLAESSVLLLDESAEILSNQRSNKGASEREKMENVAINEFLSKIVHYINAYAYFAEQSGDENYIGLRRVVYKNRNLLGLTELCQPVRLMKRVDKLKFKVLQKSNCTLKQLKKYERLTCKIGKIGFMRIDYDDRAGGDKSQKVVESGYYVLPKKVPYKYVRRAYMFEYEGFRQNQKIVGNTFKSMYK